MRVFFQEPAECFFARFVDELFIEFEFLPPSIILRQRQDDEIATRRHAPIAM
jgi:hypothetical protein